MRLSGATQGQLHWWCVCPCRGAYLYTPNPLEEINNLNPTLLGDSQVHFTLQMSKKEGLPLLLSQFILLGLQASIWIRHAILNYVCCEMVG